MVTKTTKVKCPHCNGSGKVDLIPAYELTMRLLRKNQPITAAELSVLAGCNPTAMNNRLNALERYGLAKGTLDERDGRKRLYEALQE